MPRNNRKSKKNFNCCKVNENLKRKSNKSKNKPKNKSKNKSNKSKCIRKDGKVFDLPRRFSRKSCKNPRGFTMVASCAPFKFC